MKSILPPLWKVPDQFVARLGDSVGRQRAMLADGHLLLVLHEPPERGAKQRCGRLFWRLPDGTWQSTLRGTNAQALKRHVTEFAERVQELEDQLQSADRANDYFQVLQAVARLHRTARNLHTTLQQAREMVPDDRDLISARDLAYGVERSLELLQTDAKNGLDVTIARHAERQAERSYEMAVSAHRLNILAAIFLPLAALSSIFGMNLTHGLEWLPKPWRFWGVLSAGLIFGILLTLTITKKPVPPGDSAEEDADEESKRAR